MENNFYQICKALESVSLFSWFQHLDKTLRKDVNHTLILHIYFYPQYQQETEYTEFVAEILDSVFMLIDSPIFSAYLLLPRIIP